MLQLRSRQEAGIWMPVGDHTMARMVGDAAGLYDRETIAAALEHVREFGRAIDAGAHIGTVTRQFAGRFGEVLAFEPDREMFEYLGFNTADISNVRRFPLALGNKTGRVRLSHQGVGHNSMGWVDLAAETPGRHWVFMVTLDALEFDHLGLLKVDVEGTEVDVLEGAKETLARCRPVVIIEQNWCAERSGHGVQDARDLLLTMGMIEAERVQALADTVNVILKWPDNDR